jgi:hypothetical protein
MAEPKVTVAGTPNPNAAKFTVDRTLVQGRGKTFSRPEDAKNDPLARRLFEIEGVASVFVLDNFVTVTKAPDVSWDELAPRIARAIKEALR